MIEIAQSPKQLSEVYQLRHQVYCLERGFEPGENSEETDEFDCRSRHVLLRESTGQVVGTVRIIAPDPANLAGSFPIQRLCDPGLLQALPLATAGEISRFAISKERRGRRAEMLTRLALMRGVAQLSTEMGLTHWLAVMERGLIRLQHRNSIHFEPLGPLVSYHGIRQPAVGEIVTVVNRIRREEFSTWSYLTDGGRWCGHPEAEAPAADQDRCEDPGGRVTSPDPRHIPEIPQPDSLG
jgi:N-acyl amino acid synthase of PEP-CTERM/exosortase system